MLCDMFDLLADTLSIFARAPSASIARASCGIYYDSGVPSWSESWQIHARGIDGLSLAEGSEFFGGRPRCVPTVGGTEADAIIAASGAVLEGTFFDMRADVRAGAEPPRGVFTIGRDRSREWADACWRGFDADEPAPDEFAAFAEAMTAQDEIYIIGASGGDEIEATGLAAFGPRGAMSFYIATCPRARRQGLGSAVMRAIEAEAARRGARRLALIATPSGRALYETVGYAVEREVRMWRYGDE